MTDIDGADDGDDGTMVIEGLPTLRQVLGTGRSQAPCSWTLEQYRELTAAKGGTPPTYAGQRLRDKQTPAQRAAK